MATQQVELVGEKGMTVGDVRCWALDRTTFKSVMIDTETGRQRAQDAFLQQVPVLVGLSPIERLRVADALIHLPKTCNMQKACLE